MPPLLTASHRMRLLHTSDWHLGQHFMGKSRQPEHQALIDWLLVQTAAHAVDAVVIAGDIFDTGAPPSYARELYNQLVERLHDGGVGLVLLGGNHDSPAVLGESRSLLARLGTWVIPCADDPASQALVLRRRDGTPGCVFCAIPFLRPRDLLHSQAGESADAKLAALQNAIQQHYAAVFAAAQAKQAELGSPLPIVASGHLTTVGASSSESVREIYVGALEAFPTNAFPPADYIALGHIHRPQSVGGQAHIRYSGSPLALSFDEARQAKEMLLVELDPQGLRSVTPLTVPCFQGLVAIRCTLAGLPAAVGAAAAQAGPETPVWLEVTIEEDDYLADLPARIQAICEGWPVEVLRIRRARAQASASLSAAASETLDELTPEEVFSRRLAQETLPEPLAQALHDRYRQILTRLSEESA